MNLKCLGLLSNQTIGWITLTACGVFTCHLVILFQSLAIGNLVLLHHPCRPITNTKSGHMIQQVLHCQVWYNIPYTVSTFHISFHAVSQPSTNHILQTTSCVLTGVTTAPPTYCKHSPYFAHQRSFPGLAINNNLLL